MISLATDSDSESYGPENISVPTPLTTQNLIVVACVQASPYPPKGNEPITVLGNASDWF